MKEYTRIRCAGTTCTEPMTSKTNFQTLLSGGVPRKMMAPQSWRKTLHFAIWKPTRTKKRLVLRTETGKSDKFPEGKPRLRLKPYQPSDYMRMRTFLGTEANYQNGPCLCSETLLASPTKFSCSEGSIQHFCSQRVAQLPQHAKEHAKSPTDHQQPLPEDQIL